MTRETEDCGQIGLPACDNDDGPFCRQGVALRVMGQGTFCQACGDYGQACCPDTDYPCDYGSCQNGVCLPDSKSGQAPPAQPDKQPNTAAIMAALNDCRLANARAMLAALPDDAPELDELTDRVARAIRRENEVRAIYDDAQTNVAEARAHLQAGRTAEAALAFGLAENLLKQARRMSLCRQTIATIDEAIAIVRRNAADTFATVDLEIAAEYIDLCDFDQAADLLNALRDDAPGKAAVRARLDAALDRESRVIALYRDAQSLHDSAKARMSDQGFADAAGLFTEAREGFLRARQQTECITFRDTIAEAIAVTGRNLNRALTASGPADTRLPERYTPRSDAPTANADPTPVGSHPCLDPSVTREAYVKGYSGFGGGGQSFDLKGSFICGFEGSFTLLSAGALTGYACTKEGQRYKNCEVRWSETISSEGAVHDGYVYRYRDDSSWIVVHADD